MRGLPKYRRGISLVAVAILLLVSGILLVGVLPGKTGQNRSNVSLQRVQRIEQATEGFMAAKKRRPCPADNSRPFNTAEFGVEADNPGTCNGGTIGANFSSGTIVAGGVPTKSLGLGDEYALDDFGRRLTYVVDMRATEQTACSALTIGDIIVKDGSGSTLAQVMAAYISYGSDGQGAWPSTGGSVRMKTGNGDADTLTNAYMDTGYSDSFSANLVKKEATSRFDDTVWFSNKTKNRCTN